jgi:hypothetical protein
MYRARFNLAAGEDVRYLPRRDARRLSLPESDFWLFDSKTLATLHFTEADEIEGVELSVAPADVVLACQVRDAAWHYALAHAAFTVRYFSTSDH